MSIVLVYFLLLTTISIVTRLLSVAIESQPVPTTVYTPDTYIDPIVREVLEQSSRQALIQDPRSLHFGINVARIVPNDNAVAIMGMQRGDEGKGVWVGRYAELRPEGGVNLRGGGGMNMGHERLPRGAVRGQEVTNRALPAADADSWIKVVGRAVLANPAILISEINRHGARGFDNSPRAIMVDGQSFLAWGAHEERDKAEEALRGANAVGTTKSGVGPAAADYAGREGINFGMLRLPPHELQQVVFREVERNNRILKALKSDKEYDPNTVYLEMQGYADTLRPYIQNTYATVMDSLKNKRGNFVFEAAQAFAIGRDTGYPEEVTSTNCGLTTLSHNYRISADHVGNRIGVMKLISTYVGNHTNHTPVPDAIASKLYANTADHGTPEKGAVSGRRREYYWTSMPEIRAAIEVYGINQIVISKADIADGARYIEFGMEYVFPDGTVTDSYDPSDPRMRDPRTRMNTLRVNVWPGSIAGMRDFQDAPIEMLQLTRAVSHLAGRPVVAVGTGPGYDDFIPAQTSVFDRSRSY